MPSFYFILFSLQSDFLCFSNCSILYGMASYAEIHRAKLEFHPIWSPLSLSFLKSLVTFSPQPFIHAEIEKQQSNLQLHIHYLKSRARGIGGRGYEVKGGGEAKSGISPRACRSVGALITTSVAKPFLSQLAIHCRMFPSKNDKVVRIPFSLGSFDNIDLAPDTIPTMQTGRQEIGTGCTCF